MRGLAVILVVPMCLLSALTGRRVIGMTGGYGWVLPLMIANMTAYALARHFRPEPIYEALLAQDGIELPHAARTAHLLESLMGVAFRSGALRLQTSPREPALRKARVCYDHLAGDLAVQAGLHKILGLSERPSEKETRTHATGS